MSLTKYGPWKIGRYDDAEGTTGRHDIIMLDADTCAYREVIWPKREAVVRYTRLMPFTNNIGHSTAARCPFDTHRLHIPLVDGDLEDGAMIRVERL